MVEENPLEVGKGPERVILLLFCRLIAGDLFWRIFSPFNWVFLRNKARRGPFGAPTKRELKTDPAYFGVDYAVWNRPSFIGSCL